MEADHEVSWEYGNVGILYTHRIWVIVGIF